MGRFIHSEFESRHFYPTVRKIWNLLWLERIGHNELKKGKPLLSTVTETFAMLPSGQKKMIHILLCALKNKSKLSIQLQAGG